MNAAEAVPYRGGRVPAADRQPQAAERSPLACTAYDCPCQGSIDAGGGFVCPWHFGRSPDRWQEITRQLHQEQWLIDLVGELQRLYAEPGKGHPWIARAMVAFREEPDMQPTDEERRVWAFYLWRLREELAVRVGARADRPQPRRPQCEEPAFTQPVGHAGEGAAA